MAVALQRRPSTWLNFKIANFKADRIFRLSQGRIEEMLSYEE